VLAADDPRVDGRRRAELFSADRMAARVVAAWRALLEERGAAVDLYSTDPIEEPLR
jgi:hypothetical protein